MLYFVTLAQPIVPFTSQLFVRKIKKKKIELKFIHISAYTL